MSTESYTKASADFNKWVRESLRLDLSPAGIAAIIVQHGAAMRAAFSENAETASKLKAAEAEVEHLRGKIVATESLLNTALLDRNAARIQIDAARQLAQRATQDLDIFMGSVNDSHDFLNTYQGVSSDNSSGHGTVTTRIKALLEAKDKFISDALVRISDKDKLAAGQEKRIVELEAKVAKLDADTAIDLQVYALSQADKMRLRMLERAFHNVDELLTKHGVSRDGYVTQKIERLIANKDAAIADRNSQYIAAADELTACRRELRCFISSPNVNTSDLRAMITHVKRIIGDTHVAIDAAGLAFVDICGTQTIVNKGLPADRIRELVSETLAKAKERREEASEDLDSLKQQGAAWSEVVDQVSAGNPRLWDSSLSGKLIVINEIKRLQTEAAKPKVMAVDFETYRSPWRHAPFEKVDPAALDLECRLEDQKRETAKWKRAARAHASGLASIKRVLDSIAPFPLDSFEDGVAPVSASLVDRIRALAKDRDILKSMEAANRTLAKELETAHRKRFSDQREFFSAKIQEAHAILDRSKYLTPQSTSHRSLAERIENLVAWSNLYV